jgi:two-component system cell cycle response regulator
MDYILTRIYRSHPTWETLTALHRHATIVQQFGEHTGRFKLTEYEYQLLLVEDNYEYAGILQLVLRKEGPRLFEIQHVSSLAQAYRALVNQKFDIILLDLTLPDSDGLETIIQAHAYAPNTPIVVMTALTHHDIVNQAIQEGAQDYLIKGVPDGAALVRSLRYAIQRNQTLAELQRLSMIDELTGLLNRRGFMNAGERHVDIARRAKRNLMLFFADLDDLKLINDRYGHLEGDQALRNTARMLASTFRHSDVVARYGGDEFAILAIDADGGAICMADRLKQNLKSFNRDHLGPYPLSISFGLARYEPDSELTLENLLDAADRELYQRKQRKRHE